jgi:hypothetical protein
MKPLGSQTAAITMANNSDEDARGSVDTDTGASDDSGVRVLRGFGVQPSGNAFFDELPLVSLGLRKSSLARLPHAELLSLLEFCDATGLCRLGSCCRMLYVFANHPPLWKNLVLGRFGGNFESRYSWKRTYYYSRNTVTSAATAAITAAAAATTTVVPASQSASLPSERDSHDDDSTAMPELSFPGLYSDLLHTYWFHSTGGYAPEWLEVDNIDRRSGLSVEEFNRLCVVIVVGARRRCDGMLACLHDLPRMRGCVRACVRAH